MFSWSGLHLDSSTGGCVLYIMALKTAETVGMYSVLFLARSQVRPISWQSLLNILLALSSLVLLSCVPFLAFSCKNNHIQYWFGHKKTMHKRKGCVEGNGQPNCLQCKRLGRGHMGRGRVTFWGSTLESCGEFSQNSKKKTLKVNLHCPTSLSCFCFCLFKCYFHYAMH